MPVTSASWKASLPSTGRICWPLITITGDESISAVSRPVTVFVAPGPEVTSTTPGLSRRARVAVGHVRRALLVAHQDQLDRGIDEGVEDRHRGAAGEAEDVLHALALEALDQLLPARRHAVAHGRLVSFWSAIGNSPTGTQERGRTRRAGPSLTGSESRATENRGRNSEIWIPERNIAPKRQDLWTKSTSRFLDRPNLTIL